MNDALIPDEHHSHFFSRITIFLSNWLYFQFFMTNRSAVHPIPLHASGPLPGSHASFCHQSFSRRCNRRWRYWFTIPLSSSSCSKILAFCLFCKSLSLWSFCRLQHTLTFSTPLHPSCHSSSFLSLPYVIKSVETIGAINIGAIMVYCSRPWARFE